MTTKKISAYARAGVDIDKKMAGISAIKNMVDKTGGRGALSGIGLFGGMFESPGKGTALVASADGAIADALASDRGGALLYDAARWAIDLAFGPAEILDLGKITENGELRIENRR